MRKMFSKIVEKLSVLRKAVGKAIPRRVSAKEWQQRCEIIRENAKFLRKQV